MLTGACRIVTVALPATEPDLAVIVALPLATAVTSPVESTDATAGASVDHVTVAAGIGFPFWSRTSAAIWTVSLSDASVSVEGETRTELGIDATGSGGPVGWSPEQLPSTHAAAQVRRAVRNAMGVRYMKPFITGV